MKISALCEGWTSIWTWDNNFRTNDMSTITRNRSFWSCCSKKENHMSIRLIVVSVLHSPKHIGKNLLAFGITSCSQIKTNLAYLDRMRKFMIWRMPKKEFNPKRTLPTVKHTGRNVKCWGCLSTIGVGILIFIDRNMTDNMYHNILEKNLFESVKKLNLDNKWIFQHDNDPKHRPYVVAYWLVQNGVERLKCPSFSPDINLWDGLERWMKNE